MNWQLAYSNHSNLDARLQNIAIFTKRWGNTVVARIEIMVISTFPPSEINAEIYDLWQKMAGYPPQGYGYFSRESVGNIGLSDDTPHIYLLGCFANCD